MEYPLKHFFILICSLLFLQSCATMSKNECLSGDWRTIGFEDGAKGYGRERIGEHRQACVDYGVAPDLAAYQQGYEQGLLSFCTPRNGFAVGRNGYEYTGICPARVEEGFLQGYEGGREIYRITTKSNNLGSDLQRLYSRLERTEHDLYHSERMLHGGSLSKNERRELRRTIDILESERFDLEMRYRQLRDEKDRVDDRLDFLHRRYSDYE